MFEVLMLICFGMSWPVSIFKTITAKRVEGKSVIFLWLIFIGYICGVTNKVLTKTEPVIFLYAFNGILVFIDILLYYKYRKN
jgi:hypothetical protein